MDFANTGTGPLRDLTVIDMTQALAGPYATFLLAGLGARVIKVENPRGDPARNNAPYLGRNGATLVRENDDDMSLSALGRLRNKMSVTLNLKHTEGKAVLADLVRHADVVVENYAAGTLERLGIGYEFMQQVNPRIVHCSISGFGQGDSEGAKAMDIVIQALSGVMYTSGEEGAPPVRMGLPIADLGAPLFGVIGILAALHQAKQTGKGQQVDVSMLGTITSLVACEGYDVYEQCGIPLRTGPTVPRLAPFGVYRTCDGYIAICATMDAFARDLFTAMGNPELISDERFSSRDRRVKNVKQLESLISAWTSLHSSASVAALLEKHGVPAAPVRRPYEAVRDPGVVARGETIPILHPKYGATADVYGMGLPIRFSDASSGFDRPAPGLGEHNTTVYAEFLGYDATRIAQMRETGVI
jgi:CoA:oxalate CoA-transferase